MVPLEAADEVGGAGAVLSGTRLDNINSAMATANLAVLRERSHGRIGREALDSFHVGLFGSRRTR
jgi:hypothetical protein